MTLLLLLLVQDPSAFATGDDGARDGLLRQGVSVLRTLRAERDKSPARVDALIFEIKKTAAHEGSDKAFAALQKEITIDFEGTALEAAYEIDLPLLIDPTLPKGTLSKSAKIKCAGRPAREALDDLCRQAGLDYGLLYGRIVLSMSERLWPAPVAKKAPALTGEALAAAKADVQKLNSE